MKTKIPVIILTGFLGSGKTTLLNRLLINAPKTALIMNEFGSTPVDQDLIKGQGMPLTILAGGCLCCQIKGTLAPTLRNLWMAWDQAEAKPFDRIIIETSGVASPEPILDTLLRDRWLSRQYKLDRVITTLAIPSAVEQIDRFAEVRSQVAWADVLLLTHGDLANANQHTALQACLQIIAPGTQRFIATREQSNLDTLLAGCSQNIRRLSSDVLLPNHSFRSISLQLDQPIHWLLLKPLLENLLARYPKDLLRIKGVVYLSEQSDPAVIQATANKLFPPSSLPKRATDDHRGRLVFIFNGNHETLANELVTAFGAITPKDAIRLH